MDMDSILGNKKEESNFKLFYFFTFIITSSIIAIIMC